MPSETLLERYAPSAKALVVDAQALADERKHAEVEPVHILFRALDRDRGVAEVFRRAGAEPSLVAAEAERALGKIARGASESYLSRAAIDLLARAEREARDGKVELSHLLNALSQEIRGNAASVLQAFSLGPGSFRSHMDAIKPPREEGAASSATAEFVDLVARAHEAEASPVIGRAVEVQRLLQILGRRHHNHPLLVGEHGVGKSAIVHALAGRIANGEVPSSLLGARVIELDVASLVAGTKLRSELETRLQNTLGEIRKDKKDTLLFISGIDSIAARGTVGARIGDFLQSLLSRGEIRLIGTTTPDGLRSLLEEEPSLCREFTTLTIDPATEEQAVEILRGIASRFEQHHGVSIGDPAIVASVRLAKRYLQDRVLPESAIGLLDEAASEKRATTDGLSFEGDATLSRLSSLKAQKRSLTDDTDDRSVRARTRIDEEIATLEPKATELRQRLDSRRNARASKESLEKDVAKLENELAAARDRKDATRVSEIDVLLPDAKRKLEAARATLETTGGIDSKAIVTDEDVARVLGDWTGIPVRQMMESEAEKLLKMEERLGKRIVGQAEAVVAMSRAVRRGRVGLRDPGKPIGSFLLLGPSGVGKTELAKALAEFLFDDEQALTRLDMSEFMEKHMAQRLVGAPPGYVDSEQGGFLTESVRRRPYSVLLFDEIEKAHGDVFNLLLQVLDDGRLTDGRGRTADFSNTVVVMTSNIGGKRILETPTALFETEDGRDALRDVLLDDLKAFLRPEFLNRIDDIIVFRPLSKNDLRGIVDIQLVRLERMLTERDIKIELTDAAKSFLVDHSYEPAFGARPLKRTILKRLQDPLAEAILQGGYGSGSRLAVDVEGDALAFKKVP